MGEAHETKYRYNDLGERYKRINKIYVLAMSCLWLMYIAYLLLKLANRALQPIIVYANLVLIIIYLIGNLYIYFRNKESHLFKTVTIVEIGIEVLLIGGQTDAEFIYFTMLGVLALQIPYYDKKSFKRFCVGYTILYSVILVVRAIKGVGLSDVDSMCRSLCIYLMIFILNRVAAMAREFSDDALGSVEEQSGRQKKLFDGILDVSRTVQDEAVKSNSIVDELVKVTETVATSMQEIAAAANTTALSIEEQNTMTQTIQNAIGETGERSKKMVGIAISSNDSIQAVSYTHLTLPTKA